MSFRTGQKHTTTVSRVLASVMPHIEGQFKRIIGSLNIDSLHDIFLLDFDSLISFVFWFQKAGSGMMKKLVKLIPLLCCLFAIMLFDDSLVYFFVLC